MGLADYIVGGKHFLITFIYIDHVFINLHVIVHMFLVYMPFPQPSSGCDVWM